MMHPVEADNGYHPATPLGLALLGLGLFLVVSHALIYVLIEHPGKPWVIVPVFLCFAGFVFGMVGHALRH
jgi:hypothetical protein